MDELTEPDARWQHSIVPQECAGLRLDVALSKLFAFSRASLQRWIEEGLVYVNGIAQKKRYIVEVEDRLSICPTPPPPSQVAPEAMAFEILYEDPSLFIINKPAGLVVHPAPGNRTGTFVNGFVAYCSDLECEDPIRPGLVHRLDKDTSGVLVAAKTPSVLAALSKQFQDRSVQKEYLAIVCGRCEGTKQISEPIGRDPKNRQKMAIVPHGKEAHTEVFSLRASEKWSLVKAVPHTGRTHQIRLHLKALGYPILGDVVYGRQDINSQWGVRQMLHCWSLSFMHPSTNMPFLVQAPIPGDMKEMFMQFFKIASPSELKELNRE